MARAGGRHPLQVMAILHTHYGRLLRLDGSGAQDEAAAGGDPRRQGLRGEKALERSRAMGPEAIHEAIQLLAQADLDLRGPAGAARRTRCSRCSWPASAGSAARRAGLRCRR